MPTPDAYAAASVYNVWMPSEHWGGGDTGYEPQLTPPQHPAHPVHSVQASFALPPWRHVKFLHVSVAQVGPVHPAWQRHAPFTQSPWLLEYHTNATSANTRRGVGKPQTSQRMMALLTQRDKETGITTSAV